MLPLFFLAQIFHQPHLENLLSLIFPQTKATTGMHILIAEDEKHARLTMSIALRQAGYQVTLAEDGEEALDKILALSAGSSPIELLISDIQMPRLDGIGLIERLQEQGFTIPVMGITGFGDKEMVVELLRRGCKEYLDKPFTPEEMLARVEKIVRQARAAKVEKEVRLRRLEEDRRHMHRQIQNYQKSFRRLWQQLDSAADAYQGLLNQTMGTEKLPLAWRTQPLVGLGGDYLDIFDTEIGCDILLADVAGHDMGASYNAVLIKTFFDENCRKIMDLQAFFQLLNLHLGDRGRNERLVTALLLRLDLENRQGYLVSAAHPSLIMAGPRHPLPRQLQTEGSVLGIFAQVDFSMRQFPLLPGDRFFLCTDGVLRARRPFASGTTSTALGTAGLIELIRRAAERPVMEAVEEIWEGIMRHCDRKPHDDMVLLGLEIPEAQGREKG